MRWMAFLGALWAGGAAAEAPVVVADIPPVHSLVARVMAGVGEPVLLLDGTASPHGGSLRPSQARALAGADLVVWTGAALTPWLDAAIPAGGLALLEAEGTHRLDLREGGGLHDGHDDHDHGHEHGHGEAVDPHAWLDPVNGQFWLGIVAEALSRIDPPNAALYAANAAAGAREIDAVRERIVALLGPVSDRRFAVAHDAFHYFEERFGLEAVTALTAGDGDEAGPRRVRTVRARLTEGDIACLFAEPGDRASERLVRGTPVRVARLDQLGARLTPGAALYPALLEGMAREMATCLAAP